MNWRYGWSTRTRARGIVLVGQFMRKATKNIKKHESLPNKTRRMINTVDCCVKLTLSSVSSQMLHQNCQTVEKFQRRVCGDSVSSPKRVHDNFIRVS